MKSTNILLLFIIFFDLSAIVILTQPQPPTPYSYFHLVQTWPATWCYDPRNQPPIPPGPPQPNPPPSFGACKTGLDTKFYLHGLWPADNNGRSLAGNTCQGQRVCRNQILARLGSGLATTLRSTWSITSSTDETFWRHEWNSHGVCSEHNLPLQTYFQTASNLYTQHDLYGYLTSAGITASPTTGYTELQIVTAIKNGLGNQQATVDLVCLNNITGLYLRDIYLCLDPTATNLAARCPSVKRSCSPRIIRPIML